MKRNLDMRVAAMLLLGILVGCSTTNYQAYEGRTAQIIEGQGGTKEVIDGYEIWDNGDPPRRYQVMGVATVEDFDNVFGNSRMRSAIADQIKAAKGDAAIVQDGWTQGQSIGSGVGFSGTKTVYGTTTSTGRKQIRYRIVKYLDKPASAATPPTTVTAPVAPACFIGGNGKCM